MNKVDLEMLKLKAEELIAVPHCYGELKEVGKQWLDSIGTENEKDAAKAFITELEEDVLPIDALIAFTQTKEAIEKFGKEAADNMLEGAKVAKEKGEKYCTCAACKAGGFILDLKDFLLK